MSPTSRWPGGEQKRQILILNLDINVKFDMMGILITNILWIIPPDNPHQRSRVPVLIKVLDVNDNAPEFAMIYETFVCENVKAGQVFIT